MWLLAALVAAAGLIAIVEVVAAAAGGGYLVVDWPRWARALGSTAWSARAVRAGAFIVMLLGLLLLALALARGAPRRLTTRWGGARAGVFVDRRGLARALRARALAVDGVDGARVRIGARTADVRLRLRDRAAGGAASRAAVAVRRELDAVGLVRPPRLVVRPRPEDAGPEDAGPEDAGPEENQGGPPVRATSDRPTRHDAAAGWDPPAGSGGPCAGAGRSRPDGRHALGAGRRP